ncbi:MAG: hypothetical protein GY830_10255, partial [Bacteroidetes bacterium]|nr:hypothetical protein [Bacteroidota bacterium]
ALLCCFLLYYGLKKCTLTHRQTDRQTNRQTTKETNMLGSIPNKYYMVEMHQISIQNQNICHCIALCKETCEFRAKIFTLAAFFSPAQCKMQQIHRH